MLRTEEIAKDRASDIAALCPNCHCRAYHAADRAQLNQTIARIIHTKEKQLAS